MSEATDKLNLTPRSTIELHHALEGFEQKWFLKARHIREV